jgi:hypothetical protein
MGENRKVGDEVVEDEDESSLDVAVNFGLSADADK